MTALVGAALLLSGWCAEMRTTGYSRYEHGSHTYDGTPILTSEAIGAASWDIPMGWYASIPELGITVRIADRGGGLGSSGWIDVAVWDRQSAYAITGWRQVCVSPPGGSP